MASPFDRTLSIETPLGPGALILESFTGQEEMSRLFEFELRLLSDQEAVDPTRIVGKSVVFSVDHGSFVRFFGGFVANLVVEGQEAGGERRYRARVVPWLWLLTKRSNYRIFQQKTVPEIVQAIFRDAGVPGSAFEASGLTGDYAVREYCVQFGETDFDFVSRLLEDEGIFYYFRFDQDGHTLVLADSAAAYKDIEPNQIEFTESEPGCEQVSRWEHGFHFVSGKWSSTDFDFTKPTTDLRAETTTVVPLPGLDAYERYEYPGGHADKQQGEGRTKARMEAEEACYDVVHGEGACHAFHPGGKFELARHPFPGEEGKSYVLTAVTHQAREVSYSTAAASDGPVYTNRFRCLPKAVVFRPQRTTPRPRVPGPQTAIVVGPAGEEIHTDEYGRIKVQFHWDREGKYDEKSSCWIRVAQSTAGREWGSQVLPRVNQEVIVEFISGDPDRPIVMGAVYNANTKPAFKLPENKTWSGFRSKSTKGAPPDAFNEIRFEDKRGQEYLFVKAQRDEHHLVLNDRFDEVGNDEHRRVLGSRREQVDLEHHLSVGGDRFTEIGGNSNELVGGVRRAAVSGDDSLEVEGDRFTSVHGDDHIEILGSSRQMARGDLHREANGDVHEKATRDYAVEGTMNVHLKGGMNVVIEAGMQLTLKAGGSYVVIGPAGVDVSGPMVKLNSGGAPGAGAGANPQAPAGVLVPDAPEPPSEPIEPLAAAKGKAYSKPTSEAQAADLEWVAIETAEPTPQAAALESAAASGQPFCDT